MCKKDYTWNHPKCSCKNARYAENIIDDSIVICDEITETTKTVTIKRMSANFK